MATLTIAELEEKGNKAIRLLRKQRLAKGLPFMINTKDEYGPVCYLEYQDGTIQQVKLAVNASDFEIVRTLLPHEAEQLRVSLQLS